MRGQVIEDLKQLLLSSSHWSVAFIHREGNKVAHKLAKMALHPEEGLCWIEEGPGDISQLIVNDKVCNDLTL